MGIYRNEDSLTLVGEVDKRLREAVRISWAVQKSLTPTGDVNKVVANVETQVRKLVDRAIENFKEDAEENSMGNN